MLTFGSLFAGVGGFDLGFERAGMQCKWQVEIDSYCQKVLAKHWPHVRRHDDVGTFPTEPIEQWRVDVICGGDPCQQNSAAVGSYESTNESLGGEFIRVVDALRPRVVLRENPTRVRRGAPWPWHRFRSCLESLGYAVLPFRLRACCVGGKHQRDRLFLLAELSNSDRNGLEGWQGKKAWDAGKPARPMERMDWPDIPSAGGFNSRAGLPTYVDEMRAIGNSVCPQVAEWIGRRIVALEGT